MTLNDEKDEINIPKNVIGSLISNFSMIKGELGIGFDMPGNDQTSSDAMKWWQEKSKQEQYALRSVLAAMAAPMMVSDIQVMLEDDALINTCALIYSLKAEDPLFLIGEDKDGTSYRIKRLETRELLINMLLLYLDGGAPLFQSNMTFELQVNDFIVLMAIIDLNKRINYSFLLEHRTIDNDLRFEDILQSIQHGLQYADPRWILPFSLQFIRSTFDVSKSDVARQSVKNLVKMGLLNSANNENTFALSEAGSFITTSFKKRLCQLGVKVMGATPDGNLASQTSLFVRGDSLLWYIDIGGKKGDNVLVASIELEKARALIEELLKPVGIPKAVVQAVSSKQRAQEKATSSIFSHSQAPQPLTPSPNTADVQSPSKQRKELSTVTATCSSCGNPLKQDSKFCGKCGATSAKAATCPNCYKPLKPGKKFCSGCGHQIKS